MKLISLYNLNKTFLCYQFIFCTLGNIYFRNTEVKQLAKQALKNSFYKIFEISRILAIHKNSKEGSKTKFFVTICSEKHYIVKFCYSRGVSKKYFYEKSNCDHIGNKKISIINYREVIDSISGEIKQLSKRNSADVLFTFKGLQSDTFFSTDNFNENFTLYKKQFAINLPQSFNVLFYPPDVGNYFFLKNVMKDISSDYIKIAINEYDIFAYVNIDFYHFLASELDRLMDEYEEEQMLKLHAYLYGKPLTKNSRINLNQLTLFNSLEESIHIISEEFISSNSDSLINLLSFLLNKKNFKKKVIKIFKSADDNEQLLIEIRRFLETSPSIEIDVKKFQNNIDEKRFFKLLKYINLKKQTLETSPSKLIISFFIILLKDKQFIDLVFSEDRKDIYNLEPFNYLYRSELHKHCREWAKKFISYCSENTENNYTHEENGDFLVLRNNCLNISKELLETKNIFFPSFMTDYQIFMKVFFSDMSTSQ
ncbi:hypothetical protein NGRA_2188 [Nosema granulosis]|uniref:Uncharacterized protein n=1 Tax=Nosema granulosis TaxID=83296 RepID=A0A9P6KXY4_9MICR|nr:hypothetical protein NGRA_2188 [Nosema granulosis]